MDLRVFYQKMRKIEQEIAAPHVVIVSCETGDGGKAGVKTEVHREAAARLIVEGRGRLADVEETKEFYESLKASMKLREREKVASKLSVNIITEEDMAALRKSTRKQD